MPPGRKQRIRSRAVKSKHCPGARPSWRGLFSAKQLLERHPPLEKAAELYGRPNDLNARFFNMLATAYIRNSLTDCPKAVPLFQQVLNATQNTLILEGAQEGLDECRRAEIGAKSALLSPLIKFILNLLRPASLN